MKDKNYTLSGNFYMRNMKYLELKLWKCSNNSIVAEKNSQIPNVICRDKDFIDSYFRAETFSFAFKNNMFV